jgi:uncharacterized protein YodC (DUF2158 family)
MEADMLQSGDVVQLASGGPEMTIEEWRPQTQRYKCSWFDGGKREVGYFPEVALRKVEMSAGRYEEPDNRSGRSRITGY